MDNKILQYTKILYDYLNVSTNIVPADLIIGLGCMDKGIPEHCSKLYKEGYGKFIIFSGNVGKGTEGILNSTEAERFKNIALDNEIPEEKILLEKEATNTYENFKYVKKLLEKQKIFFQSAIIVQKPYVKRRCCAIADVEFPQNNIYVTSQNLTFFEFIEQSEKNQTMEIEEIINEIVGEISILLEAPKYNLQSKQLVPKEELAAYQYLIQKGYTKHRMTSEKIERVQTKWESLGLIRKK